MNEIKISGKIYNKKESYTQSGKLCTTFGLSVWNGKKEDKNTYEFINCKFWGKIDNTDGDKNIDGHLAFDVWEKDGKKQVRPYILVKSIDGGKSEPLHSVKDEQQQHSYNDMDDDIPF